MPRSASRGLARLRAARAHRDAVRAVVLAEADLLRHGLYLRSGPALWRHWRVPVPGHLRRTKGWSAGGVGGGGRGPTAVGVVRTLLRRVLLPSAFRVRGHGGTTRGGDDAFPLAVVAAGRRVVLLDPSQGRVARRYEPGYLTPDQVDLRRRFAAHVGGPAFEVREAGTLLVEGFVAGRHVGDLSGPERLDVARQVLRAGARLVAAEGSGDASAAVDAVLADVAPADLPPEVAGLLDEVDLRAQARTWPLVPTATDATVKNLVVTADGDAVPIDPGRVRRDPFFLYPLGLVCDAGPEVVLALLTGGLDAELGALLDAARVDRPPDADGRAALVAVRLLLVAHREATAGGTFDRERFRAAVERRGRPVWQARREASA